MAWGLWLQGYPDQALERVNQAFRLAEELDHPFSHAEVLFIAAGIHQCRGEGKVVQERAEALIALSTEHGFALFVPFGSIMRGWALVEEEHREEEIIQMSQGLEAYHATGMEMFRPHLLALLAEAYGKMEQVEEGLRVLVETLEGVGKTEQRFYEADLYRLKGELTLQRGTRDFGLETGFPSPQAPSLKPLASSEADAEASFLKAIEIAQRQQAKSLELRAVTSLARLWQRQGRTKEAHQMLVEIYNWFTEGFDTKDLQEAKVLLDELS
jgi:predicted ATPase